MKALIYFATEGPPGAVVEHSEISGTKGKLFRRVAQAT